MLTVSNITKSYGVETILDGVGFTLNAGERLGLVGPNGCGKTTLLKILTGQEKADSGTFRYDPPALQPGYLAQGFTDGIHGETIARYISRMEGDLATLSNRVEELAARMAASQVSAGLQREYDDSLARLSQVAENAGRGPAVLAAFGLGDLPIEMEVKALSGGQKTRLALAGVLLSNPQLLLLDEPTNHLDIEMLEWLEDWLSTYRGAALVVSHDRAFLDRVATAILEIDPLTHASRFYPGSYSDYLEAKLAEREKQWQQYSDQQQEVMRLRQAVNRLRGMTKMRRGGKADDGDKFAKGFFSDQTRGVMGRVKNVEKRLERMAGEEHVEKPRQSWEMKISFGETPSSGRDVLVLEDLAVGYGAHVLLAGLNLTLRYRQRVVLIGPNGCGKTTLLRTAAGLVKPLAGRIRLGAGVRAGLMAQEQENLDSQMNAFEALAGLLSQNETEVRAYLSKFLFKGDDVFTPAGNLSFGERSRLALACLVAQGCNLLLLDEPLNHLDIPARTRFEQALATFEGTVLAVVHDRFFIDSFATEIWQVKDGSVAVMYR